MAERELKKRSAPAERESETNEDQDSGAKAKEGEELKAKLDAVLDEIDEVLEDNAEEFVRNYVQKGGE
ncbi:MAG: ubiquitin-like protein Pup [Acidimicrobiaceae bacterium]|nr:ubiquitin-like protein Pup [Acidimicrobiaceae bacterium]